MSRIVWVAVAGLAGLASGCHMCGGNRCSLLSRGGGEPVGTLAGRGDCMPAGPVAAPANYGDPFPVGIPTSGGPRPENELPMPGTNIVPPANPIPVAGLPMAMPVRK